jgi:anti-anti-sigma factor
VNLEGQQQMNDSADFFDIQEQNDITIIKVNAQRSSVEIAASLKDLLGSIITEDARFNILLDLTKMEFVESSFLGAIVYTYKEVMQKKGVIKVLVTNAIVYDRFILTQLDKLFEIFNNKEDALNSFK